MEGRRKAQLEHLTSALTTKSRSGTLDASVIMGDFNFHREAENASIPDGWREVPAVVARGETWDYARNLMLAHYLPLRNIY
jgi:endonuclease/exonuclease/phosphatase family metal-dependent hydrolase